MYNIEYSGQFKRDVKLAQKKGKDMDKLKKVLNMLINEKIISVGYKDHPLIGTWKDSGN